MLKKYTILNKDTHPYQIGERTSAGILAYVYNGYFDDKSCTFTLYPQKGGYRAPGADVRKKRIHMSEVG